MPLSVRLEQERTARREAELERDRLAFLASAGTALTTTLDPVSTVGTLAQLLVPALCDWCTVHSVDDAGRLKEAATAHATEEGIGLLEGSRHEVDKAGKPLAWGIDDVARSGRAARWRDVTEDELAARAVGSLDADLQRQLATTAVVVLPLLGRGRVIGVVTCARTRDGASGRHFDLADERLIDNVVARAGMALDNARLFAERTQVARILQQALLPPHLPEIPDVEVSARYRTAEEQLDVGGDFYDLFQLPDGCWSIVIGDVSGKGSVAAAITGLVRNTIRAVSQPGQSPSDTLRRANEVLLGQVDDTRFCTAALVHLRPGPTGATVWVASGGHPRPLVLPLEGEVRPLACTGTLLGVVPDPKLSDVEVHLGRGDAIVLYTDGVTEARRDRQEFGEAGIAEALRQCRGRSAGTIADHVARSVHAWAGTGGGDDAAVLVVRRAP